MHRKRFALLAASALALAPLAAFAQSVDISAYKEAEDDDMVVQPFNLAVDDLEDMDLKRAGGDDIGEIEEVLIDAGGEPAAVTVEVGGFLGIGEREVVLGLDQLELMDDHFVTTADKAALEAMPEWED